MNWRKTWPVLMLLMWNTTVWAAGATPMPWDLPLQTVLSSISGPVAQTLGVIAIIVFGLSLAFSDGGGLRTGLSILFGLSIAFAASTFFTSFFGFAGGVVF